jgi:hypothetical protein
MKKYFLQITILLLCCFTAVAQTPKPKPNFTLKELIALANNDDEYFDTYVTNKGFEFKEAEKTEDGCETSIYDFGASGDRLFRNQSVNKTNCQNYVLVIWGPDSIKVYNAIKNELKISGFKFLEIVLAIKVLITTLQCSLGSNSSLSTNTILQQNIFFLLLLKVILGL